MTEQQSFYIALEIDDVSHTYKCRWCPCIFCTLKDFIAHWKALGKLQYDHRRKWKELKEHASKFG